MLIKTAKFVISNTDISKCPQTSLPEYAFIGRSNVGKSSLINMLTNNNKLAMTSSKPGKTQLVNHFIINDSWYLVDLPGYGYAKQSKKARAGFGKIIMSYLQKREVLTNLFVLVDSRLKPQQIDIDFITTMGELGIPFSIVFTKIDKLSKKETDKNIQLFEQELSRDWVELPPMFLTSSAKMKGRDEILNYIDQVNASMQDAN